ncbi:MAG: transposase [Bryobacteraceae bacterium]
MRLQPERDAAEATTESSLEKADPQPNPGKKHGPKPRKNQPQFDLEAELERICGINVATLDGVDVMTIQTFISELGTDMTPWRTEDHLVSWLKLAPNRQISGGKVIKQERNKAKNRVAEALRMAASTLIRSDSYLGARFRYLRGRIGPGKAVKAMAAHLARLIYRMLTRGQTWVDRGAKEHEQRRKERDKLVSCPSDS